MKIRIVIALLGAALQCGCNAFDTTLVTACEAALKARLASPSGYQRVNISEKATSLDLGEAEDQRKIHGDLLPDQARENIAAGKWTPTAYKAVMEYDAPNMFGAPLRKISICEYYSEEGDLNSASVQNVVIDRQTNAQWERSQGRY